MERTETPSSESNTPTRTGFLSLQASLAVTFWCRAKFRRIQMGKCLDDFVSHTAKKAHTSDCFNCPQGAENRRKFADS